MGKMNDAYLAMIECEICEGKGIMNGWVSSDGDYDFEWFDCNPHHLVLDLEY